MYIVKKNNTVTYGPKIWDKQDIQYHLYQKHNLQFPVPYVKSDEKIINVDDTISIWPVIFKDDPTYNKKTQKLDGPFYEYTETHAHQYFNVIDMTVDQAKSNLLSKYSDARWQYEVYGTPVTIGSDQYLIPTTREERLVFFYSSAGSWKLKKITGPQDEETKEYPTSTVWINLTETDLETIKNSILAHIQKAFNVERSLGQQVNDATSLAEIDSLPYTEIDLYNYFELF